MCIRDRVSTQSTGEKKMMAMSGRVASRAARRAISTSSPIIQTAEVTGVRIGKQLREAANHAEKFKIQEQAGNLKRRAYNQVGVTEATGDQVLKGAAVVGAGVKTVFMFKKTIAMGAVAGVATMVGRVKAPVLTNKILAGAMQVASGVGKTGTALYRGVQKGMQKPPSALADSAPVPRVPPGV
eukprot:TRINITY_DN1209_c0_g1_i1.p1 TRINITY_DN1209_c0_g1~~TRINITY_DN1209_c0_g1_i1.p1  ORF type:complete len:183 (+),score=44.15 TRINITY_DN1209_c0_g1_i1:148-696(+)